MSNSSFRKTISEKMSGGNLPPDDFVWENIESALAEKRAKKRRRQLIWVLLPILGMGLFFLFGKTERTTFVQNSNGHKEAVEKKKIDILPATYLRQEALREKKSNQINLKTKLSESGILADKTTSVKSPILKQEVKPSFNSNENIQQVFTPSTWESDKNPKKPELTTVPRLKIGAIPKINPLQAFLSFDEKLKKTEFMSELDFSNRKKSLNTNSLIVAAIFEANNLIYCFDETANHIVTKVEGEYKINPRISAGIGIGYHQINYQFEVDETIHLESFGNTDKYPELYKFSRAVETIGSNLNYAAGSVSATFRQSVSKNWTTSLSASQDFIFYQNQKINYQLINNRTEESIKINSGNFNLGMTGFKLGLERKFGKKLTAGLTFNRYITTRTIGIERQYYHGFGCGTRIGFSF